VPLDGPDCKAASSASQADKPNVWLRRSLCTVPARRMQAFPGPERRAGVGEQGISAYVGSQAPYWRCQTWKPMEPGLKLVWNA